MKSFTFEQLSTVDLIVDAEYQAQPPGTGWHHEPLHELMPVGNQGGIRTRKARRLVVLYTQWSDPDWPDHLDPETGTLTYYGDNKRPGHDLHDTPKRGNAVLAGAFGSLVDRRFSDIPPFFVFSQLDGRNVKFEGLAVPGTPSVPPEEALVAIWRTTRGERFQNYRALFTILDVPVVARDWITQVEAGDPSNGPTAWSRFVSSGVPQPLLAPKTVAHRSPAQQRPEDVEGERMIQAIHAWFESEPTAFEACAAEIWRTIAPSTVSMDVTRPTRDGGRDAVGEYAIGPPADRVHVEFALEAKCYRLDNGVGVKEVGRLISRLRHRQFGVLVTTSYLAEQAYREIRDDRHPVAVVAARDIVDALKTRGINSADATQAWLESSYPK